MAKRGTYKDLTGQKFGRLTAVRRIKQIGGRTVWECVCSCGMRKDTAINNLQNGHVQSCGCLWKEIRRNGGTHHTHCLSRTKFYRVWIDIKTRIKNKNSKYYQSYGLRGIKTEWDDFESFRNDMYDSYLEHVKNFGGRQTSIDRIDVNGNYSKENCRWSTQSEQQENRRDSLWFSVDGERRSIMGWSKHLKVSRATLYDRLKLRLPLEDRPLPSSVLRLQNGLD